MLPTSINGTLQIKDNFRPTTARTKPEQKMAPYIRYNQTQSSILTDAYWMLISILRFLISYIKDMVTLQLFTISRGDLAKRNILPNIQSSLLSFIFSLSFLFCLSKHFSVLFFILESDVFVRTIFKNENCFVIYK